MNKKTRRKAVRENRAIHMHYCRDKSIPEIADELDVTETTVKNYLYSEPSQEVQEMVEWRSKQVRVMALEELRQQLQTAGEESRTAETTVKVWTDDDGDLLVKDQIDGETGELTGRYPIPRDIEMGPDKSARYYRREEVRDILDQMAELVGAKEPQELEVSGDGIVIDMGDE